MSEILSRTWLVHGIIRRMALLRGGLKLLEQFQYIFAVHIETCRVLAGLFKVSMYE